MYSNCTGQALFRLLTLRFARPPIGVGNGDLVVGDVAPNVCFGCHNFISNGLFAKFDDVSFRLDGLHSVCSSELCDVAN